MKIDIPFIPKFHSPLDFLHPKLNFPRLVALCAHPAPENPLIRSTAATNEWANWREISGRTRAGGMPSLPSTSQSTAPSPTNGQIGACCGQLCGLPARLDRFRRKRQQEVSQWPWGQGVLHRESWG